jgi:hypothetical protein
MIEMFCLFQKAGVAALAMLPVLIINLISVKKESRFPAPACDGRRLHSTACNERTTPLVPLASLDLPNQGQARNSRMAVYPQGKKP